ncbi:MAG: hypothetical protein WA705_05205 [Candidatus Ozemobacteraceae bacterium]
MEPGEVRSDTGEGLRIVRVGTHALTLSSRTKLWNRLYQHKGNSNTGGGNHRGSIFRHLIGTALIEKFHMATTTWGKGNSASREIRQSEEPTEIKVSEIIRQLPFLWLNVDDAPHPESLRGYIEKNAIALLSNYLQVAMDSPSPGWLGHYCNRERVRGSGMWNQNHVDQEYDPSFLNKLESLVDSVGVDG